MSARPEPEKRNASRVQPYVAPCRMLLPNGRVLTGYVTDLSSTGAQVACDGPPAAVGIAVTLQIRLRRGAREWARLKAEVKWTKPPARSGRHPTCGLRFTQASTAARAMLETVLDEFRTRAAQLGREA